VSANIASDRSIARLSQYIAASRNLLELDLSWNSLRPANISPLLEALAENRVIQHLNLSWNTILASDADHSLSKITRIIKYNKSLLHFNLSHTGLSEHHVKAIGASLRRGRSILVLHMTGNPGVTEDVKAYLQERVKCLPSQEAIVGESRKFESVVRTSLEGHVRLSHY